MTWPKLEVRKHNDREHGLYVNDQLIGTSKLDCDARLQMYFLEEAFIEAHERGYRDGIDFVASGTETP